MSNPKVSIIIPVYNTEQYLYKCLNSAIGQTLKEIEIIVINDASTDSSLEMIQEFQKIDKRIQLINFTKNKGNGIGRNTALKQAKGKYVLFLDSDDWLEKRAAEICYKKTTKGKHDVLQLSYNRIIAVNRFFTDKIEIKPCLAVVHKLYNPFFFKYWLMGTLGFGTTPWNYFYKKTFLIDNDIYFSEGVYFEDLCFVAKVVYHIRRLGSLDFPVYNYRVLREGAITSKLNKKKIVDLYKVHVHLKEFMLEKDIFKKYEKEYLIRFLLQCVEYSFLGYFRMKKEDCDRELGEFMDDLRKSDIMRIDSILILKDALQEYSVTKKNIKIVKNSYHFLIAVRKNYKTYRFVYKTRYCIYAFFTKIIKN
jgi:glycosyltransferase involved in cell wall biosynthesis